MTEAPQRRPFRLIRAGLVSTPLAILVGAVVTPDPVAQLGAMALAFAVALPLAFRLLADRPYGPRRLGAFLMLVFVFSIAGLLALARLPTVPFGGFARVVVVVLGVVAAGGVLAVRERFRT